jgi:hypothetical protein
LVNLFLPFYPESIFVSVSEVDFLQRNHEVLVPQVYNPSYSGGRNVEDYGSWSVSQIAQETLYQKYATQKMNGKVAHVVEHLLILCETLSSNPCTAVNK